MKVTMKKGLILTSSVKKTNINQQCEKIELKNVDALQWTPAHCSAEVESDDSTELFSEREGEHTNYQKPDAVGSLRCGKNCKKPSIFKCKIKITKSTNMSEDESSDAPPVKSGAADSLTCNVNAYLSRAAMV
jgi:hypothetical protein